jgi:hypothetical protein
MIFNVLSMHRLAAAKDLGGGFIRKATKSPKIFQPNQSATILRAKCKHQSQNNNINRPLVDAV